MTDFLLSHAETQLARAIEGGMSYGTKENASAPIRAEAIRRILLGLPVHLLDEDGPRLVRSLPCGVRVHRAQITGPLMLDDAAAPDGGPLPPISLKKCEFREPISLCRARLRHLSLAGSKLIHLCAQGLNVTGALDLSGVSSAENTTSATDSGHLGLCWIELREATIEGSLNAGNAKLVAPSKKIDVFTGGQLADFALDLRATRIGNELMLWPGFCAIGGINLRSARIDKDVVCSGATLTAANRLALAAAGVRIGGAALFNVWAGEDGPKAFSADGDVSFLDAEIGGSLELRGASVRSFLASNAKIGGAALLGAWESGDAILPFVSQEDVSFYAAKIAGSLDMGGAQLGRLNGQGASIGGAALLRGYSGKRTTLRCRIKDDIALASAKIVGNLDISGTALGIFAAPNVEVGGSVFLSTWQGQDSIFAFTAAGDVSLPGANITGSLDAGGATMRRLQADGAEIGGAVFLNARPGKDAVLPFTAGEKVSLMGSKIAGNLEMGGASIGRLFAANATIGGAAFLLAYNGEFETWPFKAAGVVSLPGARIGGSLEMTGASVGSLIVQNADIGGSLLLRAWDAIDAILPFRADGDVFLLGAKVRADLDLSGATLMAALYANNTSIGGNIWLTAWKAQPLLIATSLDLSGSEVRNSLIVGAVEALPDRTMTIDLTHSAVGVLNDENGMAWCEATLLRLEGFHYGRLALAASATSAKRQRRRVAGRYGIGLPSSTSADRLRWLGLQYPAPHRTPNIEDYSPDAYDRLTRAFRAAGYYANARAVTRERLRVERQISGFSFARPFQAVYAIFFDSGLSPRRAVVTFMCCVLIGWAATNVADRGSRWPHIDPVLMLETNTVNSLVIPAKGAVGSFKPGRLVGNTANAAGGELPCGDEIEPLLYALDVFVPALEIHQESRCAITTGPAGFLWRMARAIYSLLGWVVTALTVLTISGVARRHLES